MSLLLEALKKAAQEKEKSGATPMVEPAPVPTEGTPEGRQSGTQLMNLLQGKDKARGEELESLEGFQPFDDSDDKPADFSLSLISEDDELAADMGFKEKLLQAPASEPEPEEPAGLEFELELLDDDELDVAAPESVDSASPAKDPVTPLSGLTLLNDDEPLPESPIEQRPSTDTGEVELGVEAELQVGSPDSSEDQPAPIAPEPAIEVSAPEALVVQSEEEEMVAMVGPVGLSAQKPDPVPSVEAKPIQVDKPAEMEVMPSVPDPAPPVSEPAPEAQPEKAAPEPAASTPATEKPDVDPMEAAALQMGIKPGSSVYDTSPDMVLGAMKGQKRRRRLLVLLLIVTLGVTAGGFGYLQYEEQMLENQQMLARYRVPVRRTVDPAPEPVKPTIAALPESRSVSPYPADTASTQSKSAVPVEPLPEAPAEGVKDMTAEQLIAEAEAALAGTGQFTPDTSVEGAVESEAETVETTAAPSAVTISRKTVTSGILSQDAELDIGRRETEARVLSAYRAFKNGETDRALKLYQQALKEDPFSRDAVMGLAAIAAQQNDFGRAAYYYQQLLDYDPVDRAAFEGLISLPDGGLDPVEIESRLRNYLAKNPDSERAQGRLGQVLAEQNRWHEAQSAFFNAHRLNPQSASHALNVAISLDHMRKYVHARNYYEKALQLETRPGKASGMNLISVRQRLDTLSRLETP